MTFRKNKVLEDQALCGSDVKVVQQFSVIRGVSEK